MLLMKKLFLGLVFFIIGVFGASEITFAKERSLTYYTEFWRPKYQGEMLSYCMDKSKECGVKVANQYCQLMGYTGSIKYIIAHNVGLTNYIDGGVGCKRHCKGYNCDGFELIRCTNKINRSSYEIGYLAKRTFVLPRFNKYRVDWCYGDNNGCGRKVANSFCRRLGFMKAVNYSKDINISATRSIGNSKLCFGDNCEAFKQITCSR